jgi:hypothetical protein
MPSAGSGGSNVMTTNQRNADFNEEVIENGDDPYDGLTTKEIAKLKAISGETIGIDKPWEEMTTKEKVFTTFEDPTSSVGAKIIMIVINIMIITSTITFVAETMPETKDVEPVFWTAVETICIVGFTTDFIAKASTTPEFGLFSRDPMNWIDFVAILPFYIEMIWGLFMSTQLPGIGKLRLIRVVRLARILRLLKNSKSGNMTSVIGVIVSSSVAALAIPLYFLFLAVVVYASLMYYAERGTPVTCYGPGLGGSEPGSWDYVWGPQVSYCDFDFVEPNVKKENGQRLRVSEQKLLKLHPNASYDCDPYDGTHVHSRIHKGSGDGLVAGAGTTTLHHGSDCCYCLPDGNYVDGNKFESIPDGLWWCVVTFTTVGYGDKFPVTWIGRGVAIATMVTGVFFMAMPLTIVGTAFNAAWEGIQEDAMKEDIDTHKGSMPREEALLLSKWYEFSEVAVKLEQAIITKSQSERLNTRSEIGSIMQPLRAKHKAFHKCLSNTLQIYPIPDDLRDEDADEKDDYNSSEELSLQ